MFGRGSGSNRPAINSVRENIEKENTEDQTHAKPNQCRASPPRSGFVQPGTGGNRRERLGSALEHPVVDAAGRRCLS
jgi:hypothetical protein